ncbi:MAG: type II toxin-antitoxin system RelE/ParE family toxin [Armatimonadetes bacterium]|nr:type II toxin-antitoxin system RelE/ParE family toxin [Armatimonadota bacterium]NIO98178.1 type II toxin-antitoxin system RelE/ParE family toxin [Armatimonadota bacterium]
MPRNLAFRIRGKLEQLAENPYARNPHITKLQNRPGHRLRVGDWRVICEVRGEELIILVLKIAPRGEVYR